MCGFKKQKKALTFYSQSLICHCNALVLLSFIILPYQTSALPDGVFGHFNARKSYPFILLQNRRLEIHFKTHSNAIDFRFKNHYFFIPTFILFIHQKCISKYRKSYLQCRSVQGNIPQPFRAIILFSYFSGTI